MTRICEREICVACGSVISTPKCPQCGAENEPRPQNADAKVKEVGE